MGIIRQGSQAQRGARSCNVTDQQGAFKRPETFYPSFGVTFYVAQKIVIIIPFMEFLIIPAMV